MRIIVQTLIVGFFSIKSYGQNTQSFLDLYLDEQFSKLDKTWNDQGYWGKALENTDNRFNEAILVYARLGDNPETDYVKISKAIKFSFENLQDLNGGMLQLGRPVHVRTSLFLFGIANVMEKYPQILEEDDVIKEGFEKAVHYLSRPHPFSSNHNMAAMLAMRSLYRVTKQPRFFIMFKKYREIILETFIDVGPNEGYWPESEKKWSNRLSVPYLFVQSFFLMEYLSNFNDVYLEKLYEKEINFIIRLVDFQEVNLNVEMSNGDFKKKGIKSVPISNYSFFGQKKIERITSKMERWNILQNVSKMFDRRCAEIPYLRNTDMYFRFGMALKSL